MNPGCNEVSERLAELAGEVERLGVADRRHVAACPGCAATAVGERALAAILDQAPPPADPALEGEILAAVARARAARRRLAVVPVAASLLVALAGVLLLGGVPGSSLLGLLPIWSARGWATIAVAASDRLAMVLVAARAVGATLPFAVVLAGGLTLAVGLGAVAALTRRWQRVRPWRRGR